MANSVFLILLFLCFSKTALFCTLRINEMNIDSPSKEAINEFIKLKKINCVNQKPPIQLYSIIIKQYEENYHKLMIVFSADLSLSTFPEASDYFVIGSPSINPDLSFSREPVKYKKKFRTPVQIDLGLKTEYLTKQLQDVIENGNKVPLAVLLLKENNAKQLGVKQLMMPFPDATRRSKVFAKSLIINDDLAEIIKLTN